MFKTITDQIRRDRDYPERQHKVDILTRVLSGKLYDHLPHSFNEERNLAGEYIPLRNRRPSVKYNISKLVVEDSVSLLFSDGHFPTPMCSDVNIRETLSDVIKECRLNEIMMEAAIFGSVGSVAVWFRVINGRIFYKVMQTQFLTPIWDPNEPDNLLKVIERYKVSGRDLIDNGWSGIDDRNQKYWFTREWTKNDEIFYVPYLCSEDKPNLIVDKTRTVNHNLGFVPLVWIKNLPGGDEIDGSCTFDQAIDTSIEIDYQLSQAGRGLKYSSDPTLLIKEPAAGEATHVGGSANAIIVSEDGDAKLLEINGSAANAVIDYVKHLRELAMESIHGNRANADRLGSATSGRAMELMNQALVWLADRLRVSYGEVGLFSLLKMVIKASNVYDINVCGRSIGKLDQNAKVTLNWPDWYAPTSQDRQIEAAALTQLNAGGLISKETAIGSIASDYDIEDISEEVSRIKSEEVTRSELNKPRMTKQTVFKDANQMVVGATEES
jgi:hypothetical protein